MLAGAVSAVALVDIVGWRTLVVGASAVATGIYLVAVLGFRLAQRRAGETTLAGTPASQRRDQTATASRASFSMGKPPELPHSLHDPS